ncbi:MAG TPA: bifunctional UDP-N-acetylmuramoyl-tripeptide:D-alanyl-D-alanine ligase/alanine racemase, partial [Bacteroidetes bacterium]|nr:bifunctional UDP-N-acetylmuramoyl-tripeptide:D-alanyl-D-alanine ligase/alanine racemase [Bacteroidota bacterium]
LLNSPGIARFPDAQFDMVRLGIGLYGDDPSSSVQSQLLPVFVFRTTIAQVKSIQPGEAVGYGRSYIAEHPMRIAVLNVGYADGLRRSLSNGKGSVTVAGKRAPIVGRVCMDMCMVDVSHLPEAAPGMEAEIFGHHQSLRELAAAMETIPYEVLTGISQRIRRVYLEE